MSILSVFEIGKKENTENGLAEQVRLPSRIFHNELSVISQCHTTFICPDSSQPPPFITPFSLLRRTPPTPRVVYHVRWNRVSPAVNLGNGVRSETPGTPH